MKPTLDDLLHNSLIATDTPSEELNERILNQSTQKEVVPMRKKETKKPWKMAQTAAAVALSHRLWCICGRADSCTKTDCYY